jgi:hypothetical protein
MSQNQSIQYKYAILRYDINDEKEAKKFIDDLPLDLYSLDFSYNNFCGNYDFLPPMLKHLRIRSNHIKTYNNIELDNLPQNLESLHISHVNLSPLKNLPSKLQKLELDTYQCDFKHLPSDLKILILGNLYNSEINSLPQKLEQLILSDMFNSNINYLPSTLIYLRLGQSFDKKLNNLPTSLKKTWFGDEFIRNIYKSEHYPTNAKAFAHLSTLCIDK